MTDVGMTTQALSTRLRQHKLDAKSEKCVISPKLCQKEPPRDLKALHRRLRDHPARFRMVSLKTVTGTYTQAHREELKLKSKHATLKWYTFSQSNNLKDWRLVIYMVLNACFIDFSNLLIEIPKMTKPELVNTAESLTKRLRDSTLEYERLNEAYDELRDYKNVLRGRLQKQNGTLSTSHR